MACASSVFPVPVSPSKTIGTSDFAASLARLMQRVIAAFVVRRSSTFKLERRDSINFEFPRAIAGLVRKHIRSEEHTSELQSPDHLVCRLLLEKNNIHN